MQYKNGEEGAGQLILRTQRIFVKLEQYRQQIDPVLMSLDIYNAGGSEEAPTYKSSNANVKCLTQKKYYALPITAM